MPHVTVPICPEHGPYRRFAFQDRVFQFQVLHFGISLALIVFSRVVSAALAPLQARGLKIRLAYFRPLLRAGRAQHQYVAGPHPVLGLHSQLEEKQYAAPLTGSIKSPGVTGNSLRFSQYESGRRADSLIETGIFGWAS